MSQTPTSMSSAPLSPRGVKRAQGYEYYTPQDLEDLATLDLSKKKRKKIQKKTELQDLKGEVESLRDELQEPWAKDHERLQTIKELQSALETKASGLEESRATIFDLQEERDLANLELKRVMEIRNDERARRRALCTELQKEMYSLATVKAERDSAHDEQEQLRTQLQEKTLSLETVTTERDSAHIEQKQLRTQLQKKTLSLKTCETERDSAYDELEKARTQVQDTEKDRNTARAELKQLQDTEKDRNTARADVEKDRNAARAELKQLQDMEKDTARAELKQACTQLQDTEKELKQACIQLQDTEKELKQACTKLQDIETFHKQNLAREERQIHSLRQQKPSQLWIRKIWTSSSIRRTSNINFLFRQWVGQAKRSKMAKIGG
jgi:chromosome segregation ATPase